MDRPCRLYPKASVRLPVAKKKNDFPDYRVYSPIHALLTPLSNGAINARILYAPAVIRHTWVMAVCSNSALKIAAKPLQMETWLIMTTYKKSPYSTVPFQPCTTYRLATIHFTTEWQTDDRHLVTNDQIFELIAQRLAQKSVTLTVYFS